MRCLLTLAITPFLLPAIANATPVVIYTSNPLVASAVDGIVVEGITYNVTFGSALDTTFYGDLTGAFAAGSALDAALNNSTAAFVVNAPFASINTYTILTSVNSGQVYTSGSSILGWQYFGPPGDPSPTAEFTVATTPEPSSILLLTTGFLGIASRVRRRLSRIKRA